MFEDLRAEPRKYFVAGCILFLSTTVLRSMYTFDYLRLVLNCICGFGSAIAIFALAELLYQRIFLGRRFGWQSALGISGLFATLALFSIARLALEYGIGDTLLP